MLPDSTQSSSKSASQGPFPMNVASVQSEMTRPCVSARGVGRGRGRDSQVTAGAICELYYVLVKGNTESVILHRNYGTTFLSEKKLPTCTGHFRQYDPVPHVRASEG